MTTVWFLIVLVAGSEPVALPAGDGWFVSPKSMGSLSGVVTTAKRPYPSEAACMADIPAHKKRIEALVGRPIEAGMLGFSCVKGVLD